MNNLNWGIIGLGNISHKFAKNINACSNLYAVGSRNLDKAKTFKELHNAHKYYGSYEELAQDKDIDIVYISTIHSSHYDDIKLCLKNNKHVLCEKSIVDNSKDLLELINIANEKNLFLGEAMKIYHMPLYDKVKEIIKSGKLGNIKMIEASFGNKLDEIKDKRILDKSLGGGAILDIGTYPLSFVRLFLNEASNEVKFIKENFSSGVDKISNIIMKNSLGEFGSVSTSLASYLPRIGVISLEYGYITIKNYTKADTAIITYENGTEEKIVVGDSKNEMIYEILDTENAIITKNYKISKMDLTLDVVKIIEEFLK